MLYMTAWLVIAGLLCVLFVEMDAFAWSEAVALIMPIALVYSFMCLASLYICRAFPLHRTSFLTVVSVVLVASFASAFVWLALGKGIAALYTQLSVLPGLAAKFDASVPLVFGVGVLLFVIALVVHYLLLAFDSTRAAERRGLELQVFAREAELKALRGQIQPHFLFNSLNSISALTATDPAAARAMSVHLAEFFRTTLKLGQQQFIPLEEELKLVENFLLIEKVRFGERLVFKKIMEDGCGQIPVPSLVFQPLVENAINHGIAHLVEGGIIVLSAKRNGPSLVLSVSNPCDPDRPQSKSTGVGLTNIRRRIEALYGNEASFAVGNTPHEFRVELVLPTRIPGGG